MTVWYRTSRLIYGLEGVRLFLKYGHPAILKGPLTGGGGGVLILHVEFKKA